MKNFLPIRYRKCSAIFLGTLVAFTWSSLSWTVLPLHQWTFKQFTRSQLVAQVIKENAPDSGVYIIPNCENHQTVAEGPLMLSAIRLQGINPNMGKEILFHILTTLLGTVLIVFLLEKAATNLKRYFERVLFVVCVALTGAILNQIPLWNWHFFSISFVFMNIVDQLVGYFFGGLVIGALIKKERYDGQQR